MYEKVSFCKKKCLINAKSCTMTKCVLIVLSKIQQISRNIFVRSAQICQNISNMLEKKNLIGPPQSMI